MHFLPLRNNYLRHFRVSFIKSRLYLIWAFSVSIDKENDSQINITGKGHSIKTADLITAAVKQNLNEQFLRKAKIIHCIPYLLKYKII